MATAATSPVSIHATSTPRRARDRRRLVAQPREPRVARGVVGSRRSSVTVAAAGITLRTPGSTSSRRRCPPARSTASTHSAAAASASRRASMGTVPAWPASPANVSVGVALAGDRGDDADGLVEALERGALLDVDLDVAEHVVARRRHAADEVAEPDALSVAQLEPAEVEAPRQDRRAEVGGAEAHALLVGEADDLEVDAARAPPPRSRPARRAARRSGRRRSPCRGASRASAPVRRRGARSGCRARPRARPGRPPPSSRRRARSPRASPRCRSAASGGRSPR